MTSQIIPYSFEFLKKLYKKEQRKEYRYKNKEKIAEYRQKNKAAIAKQAKKYKQSKEGLIANICCDQRRSSKYRNHPMPNYSREELQAWLFSQPNFEELYQAWANSGFEKMQRPSCDRLDDYKPYTLNNLRLVTWSINKARGSADIKAGLNNKISKAVLQLTRDGGLVARHHSAIHASRITGVNNGDLSRCCNGKLETAGGFVWKFVAI